MRDLPIPSITIGVADNIDGLPDNTAGLICVDLDFRAVGELAVRTLAEYGHRSIALVGQAEEAHGRGATFPLRLRNGFDEAAAQRGINTHFVFGDNNGGRLRARLEDLFNQEHPPTALVLNCDEFGHKTVESYLAAKGLRVPDDVSLLSAGTSFDMDELDIPLDTIPLVAASSCARAVELAIESLEGPLEPRVELTPPQYRRLGTVGLSGWNQASMTVPGLQTLFIVGALISIIPVAVVFLSLQRFWRSGLAAGGVKA